LYQQPVHESAPPVNQQAARAEEAEPAAANEPRPARPEVVHMNAQGGAIANDDDDDEMRNRDWLDWVYTLVRFLLLLCILYFYSSFDRFMSTLLLVIVVYM